MLRRSVFFGFGVSLFVLPVHAKAAMYRPTILVRSDKVRLSDLFQGLPPDKDIDLGPAPALGESFIIGNAQLQAIANDYNIDWTNASPEAQVIVTRGTRVVEQDEIVSILEKAFEEKRISEKFRITLTSFPQIKMPIESDQHPRLQQLNVDKGKGESFTAVFSIVKSQNTEFPIRISGHIDIPGHIIVLRHAVKGGDEIEPDNLTSADCLAQDVPPGALQSTNEALGLMSRNAIPAGKALVHEALERPEVIRKGTPVIMIFNSNNLRVTASGTALDGGGIGDIIHVINPVTRMTIAGAVRSRSEVEVAPGSTPIAADARALTSAITGSNATSSY